MLEPHYPELFKNSEPDLIAALESPLSGTERSDTGFGSSVSSIELSII